MSHSFDHVLNAIEAIRRGKMVILVDDEDRENEGDLVMAAELVTPDAINFMAKHARGLICLSLSEDRIRDLTIPMMVEDNTSSFGTAFTVSIEARRGVSTGISAADRAHTIRVALADDTKPEDLVRPGHVFPLRARRGGVLVRTGQTEGSVDLARLAGLKPAGVICEIMNDDGTMARRPDLEKFAKEHHLIVLTIADLIEYRLMHDRLVHLTKTATLAHGEWGPVAVRIYATEVAEEQHLAIIFGDVSGIEPVLVRVQTDCHCGFLGTLFCECMSTFSRSLERLHREQRGVFVGIGKGASEPSLGDQVEALQKTTAGASLSSSRVSPDLQLREFGIGAQILKDLGLHRIRVLSNHPKRLPGLEGYGLVVTENVQIGNSAS